MDKLFELYLLLKTVQNTTYGTFLNTFKKALRVYKILMSYQLKLKDKRGIQRGEDITFPAAHF